jgi:large subunit ribosomal protein L22
MSPRKVRRVIQLVKNRPVSEALDILRYTHKAAAEPLDKTIRSAVANAISAEGSSAVKAEDLHIVDLRADPGPTMKRIRPMGMGRAYRIRKRTCHITVAVATREEE